MVPGLGSGRYGSSAEGCGCALLWRRGWGWQSLDSDFELAVLGPDYSPFPYLEQSGCGLDAGNRMCCSVGINNPYLCGPAVNGTVSHLDGVHGRWGSWLCKKTNMPVTSEVGASECSTCHRSISPSLSQGNSSAPTDAMPMRRREGGDNDLPLSGITTGIVS